MQRSDTITVLLGTGGTIAGTSARAGDNVGYTAAQLAIGDLLAAVPGLAGLALESEQVAQLDSKDMSHAVWQRLAERVAAHLARPEVGGIVITHGTDTLEETAYFLQRVLAPAKPVVLTAAMRPATALQADGPQNVLDAVAVARTDGACGVVSVAAGAVHAAREVRKVHTYRLDAFGSGDAGPLGYVEEGRLRLLRPWPRDEAALSPAILPSAEGDWPWVELVTSHAGARGKGVQALVDGGVDGLVVATTGNGTLHQTLQAALEQAQAKGVAVLRATRCAEGRIVGGGQATLPSAGDLTPVKARIELILQLLAARAAAAPGA